MDDGKDNEALITNETERLLYTVNLMLEDFKKIDIIESDLNKILENSNYEMDRFKREDMLKKIIAIRHYLSAYHKTLKDRLLYR
jgi:predicted KAP-like P-loop ATPase